MQPEPRLDAELRAPACLPEAIRVRQDILSGRMSPVVHARSSLVPRKLSAQDSGADSYPAGLLGGGADVPATCETLWRPTALEAKCRSRHCSGGVECDYRVFCRSTHITEDHFSRTSPSRAGRPPLPLTDFRDELGVGVDAPIEQNLDADTMHRGW